MTVLDSGRRPAQHDGMFAFGCTMLEVHASERGSPSALIHEDYYIYINASSRMDWVAVLDIAIHSCSCRQSRRLDAKRVTVMVVLATRRLLALLVSRRAEPAAQPLVHETSTRAVDPSHVSVCELKKLGRAIRLLNSNVACSQPDFLGLSISHVMASCMQRTVCCCP